MTAGKTEGNGMEINVQRLCGNCFNERGSPDSPCAACGYDPAGDEGRHPMALRPGSILNGKYIIGRVLGQGGFGITYLAWDHTLKIRVAVKEFFPDSIAVRQPGAAAVSLTSRGAQDIFTDGAHSFLDEARVLARFQGNLNIVGVRGFFEENRTAYFVMDYVEGTSFKSYIVDRGGKISWQEAAKVLIPVMDALEAVHLCGILHRDVTPDNIYLTKNGTVKLMDFGAARCASGEQGRSFDVFLKAGYAPIEQYSDQGEQGPYTDVYSLAAAFYAAITGFLPPDAEERAKRDTLAAPSAQGVIVPPELEAALLKGLAVRPEHRFQSMAELRTAIIRSTTAVQEDPGGKETGRHPAAPPIQQGFTGADRAGRSDPNPRAKSENAVPGQGARPSKKLPGPAARALAISLACIALLAAAALSLRGRMDRAPSGPASGPAAAHTSASAHTDRTDAAAASTGPIKVQVYTCVPQAGAYAAQSLRKLGVDAEVSEVSPQDLPFIADLAVSAGESPVILFGGALTEDGARSMGLTPFQPGNWDETFYILGLEQDLLFLKTFEALTSEVHVKDEEYWYLSTGESYGTYTGYLRDGDRDGWGVMDYADGRVYAGYWDRDLWNGRGTLTWPNGDRLECDFVDNVTCGTGIYYWADGRRYEGEFADDGLNGQGTIYYPDGTSKSGLWKNGQLTG